MRSFFKWTGIVLVSLLLILVVAGWIVHEPRPEIRPSERADSVAKKMMEAVHVEAWETTPYVSWSIMGVHQFFWDKERHFVVVEWSGNRVLLHTKSLKGVAYSDGEKISGRKAEDLVWAAWSHFANDSFWLNPVVKVTVSHENQSSPAGSHIIFYASSSLSPT